MAKGDALLYGVAAAGVAGAVAVGIYFATQGGGSPPPNCAQGSFPCSSGVCCPDGDSCAEADGSCPTGSTPDPDNPGCCVNACPESCTEDSDCSACGSGFVCEGSECTKQTPAYLTLSESQVTYLEEFQYTETCCFYGVGESCEKCTGNYTLGNATLTATVVDASGRGVPGVDLDVSAPSGSSWVAYSDGTEYTSNPVPTGSDGTIDIYLTDESAPTGYDDPDNDAYPCSACDGNGDTGTLNVDRGDVTVSAPGYPGLGSPQALVLSSIYYVGADTSIGGCSCL
ncbi:MAG TPA: Ig-like domain-containing protein [Thermoplasmata archaeon]|nr:Ig-like domain-containing protein [Thermoplasmata archaeon]